jgi:hypothetical protein
MLPFFRFIARPLTVVTLLVTLLPGWAQCGPLVATASADRMSCCMKTEAQQGMLDSGCCSVRRSPESPRVPATAATSGTVPASTGVTPAPAAPLPADAARSLADVNAESGSPGLPLYLRLSAIRR